MLPADLPREYHRKAEALERYAPAAAEAFREAAAIASAALDAWASEQITPEQAAVEGLCSAETVRRKVRGGTVENLGTKGKVKVRRGDVALQRRGAGARAAASSEQAARRAALTRMERV